MRLIKEICKFNSLSVVGSNANFAYCTEGFIFMKDIPWFEGRYAITEDWEIFSFLTKRSKWLYRILRSHRNKKTWYLTLNIEWIKSATIHRLVAKTYKDNPHNYPAVRHLDNNKLNNHKDNLEWCTYQTNVIQAFDDWLIPKCSGQTKNRCRMLWKASGRPVLQFTKKWEYINEFMSCVEAYRETWVKPWYISLCALWYKCHSSAWWFKWKYKY